MRSERGGSLSGAEFVALATCFGNRSLVLDRSVEVVEHRRRSAFTPFFTRDPFNEQVRGGAVR